MSCQGDTIENLKDFMANANENHSQLAQDDDVVGIETHSQYGGSRRQVSNISFHFAIAFDSSIG